MCESWIWHIALIIKCVHASECHRHSSVSFLRQYPRQLPVWRHWNSLGNYFHTYSLNPFSPHAVFFPVPFCTYSWRFCGLNEQKKASMNHCACISGRLKERIEEERSCKLPLPISTLCLFLPAREHWACKSFSCEGLSQPPLALFQKINAYFRKTEGTSLRGERWLFALSLPPPSLSPWDSGQWLLSWLLLSALRVMPAWASSVLKASVRDRL